MSRVLEFIRRYPAVALTVTVGLLALAAFFVLDDGPAVARVLVTGFALGVAVQQGWGMVQDALRGRWGLDVLAITAILSTLAVGEYWASIVIVLMLTGGEALEDYAETRARRELTGLLSRAPRSAHLVLGEGSVLDVSVDDVTVGQTLQVRPGEMVPVDGVLLSEAAELDESSTTGESLPVTRRSGDAVLSGAVNGSTAVTVRMTASAADSQYQQIVALVENAAESRAPFVRLADRYAVPFTLVALAIAGAAWAVTGDPVRFAEVLVVATPCPLLIAAPVSFIAGMSRAAKAGIIVKDGGTLERLARVRTVAFDKTGTLTHGTPQVARVLPAGRTDDELLALVASAEQLSNHVLARALVDEAAARGIALATDVTVDDVPGRGLRARVDGRHVVLGSYALVAGTAVDVEPEALAPGEMSVVVSVDGRYAGTVTLSDEVRDDAARTVSRLRDAGVGRMVVLTGDAQATADAVAAQVGLDEVRAGLLPQGKVDAVAGLAGPAGTSGRPVMMVGDGLNDAPVLAVADVGVAMGARGATAASESADVVVLVDELARVADAVAISRRTVRIALQSIGLGIGLSVVLMVLAAFGVIPAVVGAGLQEVVDLVAILNALRALGGPAGETGGRRSGRRRAVAARHQVRAERRDDVLV